MGYPLVGLGEVASVLRRDRRRAPWLFGCFLVASLAEGIGIATLLPLIAQLLGGGGEGRVQAAIAGLLGWLGLPATLPVLLALFALAILLKSLLLLASILAIRFAGASIATALRGDLLKALFRADWRHFTAEPVGGLANAMGMEAQYAAETYISGYKLVAEAAQVLVYLALALVISPAATAAALGTGLAIALLYTRLIGMVRRAGEDEALALNELSRQLTDFFRGIKALKAMAREAEVAPLLIAEAAAINRALRRRAIAGETRKQMVEPLLVLVGAPALYLAIAHYQFAIELVLVLAFLFHRLVTRVLEVQGHYQSFVGSLAFLKGFEAKLARAQARLEFSADGPAPRLQREIRFAAVSFAYGELKVLRSVELRIPAGRIVCLFGPSGAGKSTLLDLLLGLIQPSEGRILIDGVPLDGVALSAWRHEIGYVPQDSFLFHASILTNVTLDTPGLGAEDATAALKAAGAWDFVAALPDGLATVVGEQGGRLSGGQRQRIALARALAHRPRLLILDEATSALDPETERGILATLRGLAGAITVLAVSHQPAVMAAADLVYRIADGQVNEAAPPARAVGVS